MTGQNEPMLEGIEDYGDKASKEKKLTVWIVILSGLLIGALYGMISASSSINDAVKAETGIIKY